MVEWTKRHLRPIALAISATAMVVAGAIGLSGSPAVVSHAAPARQESVQALLGQRSPGERTTGELAKIKHRMDALTVQTAAPLDHPPIAAVPEPETWATMLVGFGLVGLAMRRRRNRGPGKAAEASKAS